MAKFLSTAIPYGFAIGPKWMPCRCFWRALVHPVTRPALVGSSPSRCLAQSACLPSLGYARICSGGLRPRLGSCRSGVYGGRRVSKNSLGYQTMTSPDSIGRHSNGRGFLAAAQLDLAAVTLPERDCLCPKTKAADVEQFHAKRITACPQHCNGRG